MSAIFVTTDGEKIERTRCEVYTRVMGYYRPVQSFNTGKKAEFYSRIYFKSSDTNSMFNEIYAS
ncbi:MAG: hypothetical protein H6767_05645 [Candidatus Peribacteria bacterium]|nr:MAG: hypothetical protein H6767_05645 [Candidatus Peribacteria bacterium]